MRDMDGRGITETEGKFRKIRNFLDDARRVSIQTIRKLIGIAVVALFIETVRKC